MKQYIMNRLFQNVIALLILSMIVFGLVRLANRIMEDKTLGKSKDAPEVLARIRKDILECGGALGVFATTPEDFLAALRDSRAARKGIVAAKVEKLMQARQDARKDKDFARADAIRGELKEMGVEVKDTPAGPVWDAL